MSIGILKEEITNDPLARGYSGMTDQQVADSLNTKNRSRDRGTVSTEEILAEVAADEFNALDQAKATKLGAILSVGALDISKASIRAMLRGANGVFAAGTTTAGNLNSFFNELISRAEELGLPRVRVGHVERARA